MSSKPPTQALQNHMQETARGDRPAQELVFDARSGEFQLAPPGRRPDSPDSVVVDQIAEDGFFAGDLP